MKIAIATFEFEGLTKNGGIGTAYRRLAELLVKQGHEVTIAFMPFGWEATHKENLGRIRGEILKFRKRKIFIEIPRREKISLLNGVLSSHLQRSFDVYQFLKSRSFDVIHSPDNCGLVYLSLLAKKAKLDFHDIPFVIGAHGSLLWTAEANRTFAPHSILVAHLDQQSIELADHLISPSQYMIDYLKQKHWPLSKNTKVIPNVNNLDEKSFALKEGEAENNQTPNHGTETIVFFGRLEARKGVYIFAEAIELYIQHKIENKTLKPLRLLILGKEMPSGWGHPTIKQWLSNRLARFKGALELIFLNDLSSAESIEILTAHRDYLVCMPSLIDNSPYVIVEALEQGLNFITTKSGGQAELINLTDHGHVLCEPNAKSLFEALVAKSKTKHGKVRPSKLASQANKMWIQFHSKLLKASKNKKAPSKKLIAKKPLVSIILGAKNEDDFVNVVGSLKSILRQNYDAIEVCIPDSFPYHGLSGAGGAIRVKKFSTNQKTNAYSAAAAGASGKYLLFLDGGELVAPNVLTTWVNAAESISNQSDQVAITGFVENHEKSMQLSIPNDSILVVLGESSENRFTLWKRDFFNSSMNHAELNFYSGDSLDHLTSFLMASGKKRTLIPLKVINQFKSGVERGGAKLNQLLDLQPLLQHLSPEFRRIAYYAAGVQAECNRLRHELNLHKKFSTFYDPQIRNDDN